MSKQNGHAREARHGRFAFPAGTRFFYTDHVWTVSIPNSFPFSAMFHYLFAALLLVACTATEASAQTTRAARKKIAPYSARKTAKKKPAVKINPHTGKPYGYGVSQDIKDGTAYLAPGVPMRKQEGYQANGGYNDNRTPRPRYAKPANSSLSRDANAPAAGKVKVKTKVK